MTRSRTTFVAMLLRGSNAVLLTGQDVKVFAFVYHPLQSGYVGPLTQPSPTTLSQEMLDYVIRIPAAQGSIGCCLTRLRRTR
jgi:hypothetical protein